MCTRDSDVSVICKNWEREPESKAMDTDKVGDVTPLPPAFHKADVSGISEAIIPGLRPSFTPGSCLTEGHLFPESSSIK